ncbi:MAG: 4,5-DOPA dioxygenase extradiol [Chitinophagaceae bacterium]
MNLNEIVSPLGVTDKMPMLFVGHGSPMNAIEQNEFAKEWRSIGAALPKPNAILCISAHWETRGTKITAMEKPPTIHDFGGFPQELFDVHYPAPGSPSLALDIQTLLKPTPAALDTQWGLDHGCWSVLRHMYPNADIPVLEMSMDLNRTPQQHYDFAKELSALRKKGVLIIGSGNMVHNLRMLNWQRPVTGYDWAIEANNNFKSLITSGKNDLLIGYQNLGSEAKLAIPTPEHYLPLLYILGLKEENENQSFFSDQLVMGSISMTSLKIGMT